MQFIKKSCFSLLELLIVLLIISFGMTLTGIKIKEIYQEQRFLSEAQQVLNHVSMAQDVMLIMDTDVQVKIASHKETGQMQIWLEVEKPMDDSWVRLIERKITLSAIHSIEFGENVAKDLTLQFSFGRMSAGKLILFETEKDQPRHSKSRQFEIELLGYPAPLGVKRLDSIKQTKAERSEDLYPAEVYEILYANSNEKNSKRT